LFFLKEGTQGGSGAMEVGTPFLRKCDKILKICFVISIICTLHSMAALLWSTREDPLWPYSLFKKKKVVE
jgi:hypothetical protein